MVGTWLGEIRSCSCLPVLTDSAWVLLNKIYQPFFTSLYAEPRIYTFGRVGLLGRDKQRHYWREKKKSHYLFEKRTLIIFAAAPRKIVNHVT